MNRVTSQEITADYDFIHEVEFNQAICTGNIKKDNMKWPGKIQLSECVNNYIDKMPE